MSGVFIGVALIAYFALGWFAGRRLWNGQRDDLLIHVNFVGVSEVGHPVAEVKAVVRRDSLIDTDDIVASLHAAATLLRDE